MDNINSKRGLTLIELIVCTLIIGILSATAMPLSKNFIKSQKETALRDNLRTMRVAIDRFYLHSQKLAKGEDKGAESFYPKSLQELVDKRFLRKIPIDPFTKERSWRVISTTDASDAQISDGKNVFNVFSLYNGTAKNGEQYSSW
jgi:general secretion pathway protein G